MSKYNSLWEYIQKNGGSSFKMTFEEIQNIAGIPIKKNLRNMDMKLEKYP